MPETIGEHGLYCPDFDDYAAVALYMQDLGTRIDDALSAQQDALTGFLNRPTIILTNLANVNVGTLSFDSDPMPTTLYNNAPTMLTVSTASGVTVINVGSPAGTVNPVTYSRGVWRFGGAVRMQNTGGITALSERELFSAVFDDVLGTVLMNAYTQTPASTTGGPEGVIFSDTLVLTGTHGVRVTQRVFNGDPTSSVDVLAGGLFWLTYEGPTDIIEVA